MKPRQLNLFLFLELPLANLMGTHAILAGKFGHGMFPDTLFKALFFDHSFGKILHLQYAESSTRDSAAGCIADATLLLGQRTGLSLDMLAPRGQVMSIFL